LDDGSGRILDLGVHKVSEVIRVDPVCGTTVIGLGGELGIPIPSAVHAAMERKTPAGRAHGECCAVLDSIGFYKHRNWSKSAGIVNAETTFARVMSDAIDEVAAQSGGAIEVIASPASPQDRPDRGQRATVNR
jgi:hypothetical protein